MNQTKYPQDIADAVISQYQAVPGKKTINFRGRNYYLLINDLDLERKTINAPNDTVFGLLVGLKDAYSGLEASIEDIELIKDANPRRIAYDNMPTSSLQRWLIESIPGETERYGNLQKKKMLEDINHSYNVAKKNLGLFVEENKVPLQQLGLLFYK